MRHVEPAVYLIARSVVDDDEMRRWLNAVGAVNYEMPGPEAGSEGSRLVMHAGKRCYMSFEVGLNPNITRIRTDMGEFIDNILKVGHGSVIEHASYSFAIENVSRVFTGEMNRHRAGMAISEGSMRYIRFDDIPYWIPTSIQENPDDDLDVGIKKSQTRIVFEAAFRDMETHYKRLMEIWADELAPGSKFKQKKQITSMMRRIIGMGVASGGVWTGNLRALRHIFTMRCAPSAEEEILLVACLMLERMIEAEPNFFSDFEKVKGYWKPKYNKV